MSGHGQFVCENGDVYEGEFKDLKRHGFGFQRWASGQQFRGFWKNDHYVSGVYRDERGRVFKGDFKRGRVERIHGDAPEMAFSQDTSLPPVNALKSNSASKKGAARETDHELDVEQFRPKTGTFKIVRRARRFIEPPATSPGPAAYTPRTARSHREAPKYTLGMKKTKCYFEDRMTESISPGPKYSLHSTLRPQTAACIRDKVNHEVTWTTPGPGSHVHGVMMNGRRATVGDGPKFGFPRGKSRQLPYENSKAPYVSSEFTKHNTTWSSPGPAQYSIPSQFKSSNSKKMSIHSRVHPLDGPVKKDAKPGPGSHNLRRSPASSRGPIYSFGAEKQRKEFYNPNIISPGPVYNIRSEVCTYPRGFAQISFTH